jgi:Mg2+ and Co2+ transporter CorA
VDQTNSAYHVFFEVKKAVATIDKLHQAKLKLWVDFQNPTADDLESLSHVFPLHSLTKEDILA